MSRRSAGWWLVGSLVSMGLVLAWVGPAPVRLVRKAMAAESGSVDRFGDKLQLRIDRNKIDLERHRLEITLNRQATEVALKAFDANKVVLAEESFQPKESAGETILLRWSPSSDAPVARIELFAKDEDDNRVRVTITVWALEIPHEDVHFDTDKSNILPSEVPKLKDALEKIRSALQTYKEMGNKQLFIAGHTDTVGSASHNLDLSRRRAQAIAAWFVKSGLTIPVVFEGFGESLQRVRTKDEVDEPKNRRVDYVIAVEPPPKYNKLNPAWKTLNRK